jgi:hypothetical protein
VNATLFVALFIIIAVVVFGMILTWSNRNKKKKERRKLIAAFDDFVIKNTLTIDKKQAINKNMIGIDRLNLKLVFLDNSKSFQVFHLINLEDLSACYLIKQKNASSGHISKIFLQCIFKNNSPEIVLPFYDEMTDQLFKMLRLSKKAIYWQKCISIFRQAAELCAQNAG